MGKNIDTKDFDVTLAEEVSENEFENMKDIHTDNPIYLTGILEGKPDDEDVYSFVLVYQNGKAISYGLETRDKKMKYYDIEQ